MAKYGNGMRWQFKAITGSGIRFTLDLYGAAMQVDDFLGDCLPTAGKRYGAVACINIGWSGETKGIKQDSMIDANALIAEQMRPLST